jgi:hypothetical protein
MVPVTDFTPRDLLKVFVENVTNYDRGRLFSKVYFI